MNKMVKLSAASATAPTHLYGSAIQEKVNSNIVTETLWSSYPLGKADILRSIKPETQTRTRSLTNDRII